MKGFDGATTRPWPVARARGVRRAGARGGRGAMWPAPGRPRLAAAFTLGYMGRPALPALPDLAAALGDGDADVRWAAARALVALGTRWALAHFVRALDDADARVRLAAAEGLARNGADDPT